MTNEQRLAEVRAVGAKLKALRDKQAPDSPLAGTAFELAKLCGEMEREFLNNIAAERSEARS